jgi:hypothetical protein
MRVRGVDEMYEDRSARLYVAGRRQECVNKCERTDAVDKLRLRNKEESKGESLRCDLSDKL